MYLIIILLVIVLLWIYSVRVTEHFDNKVVTINQLPKKYKIRRDNCFELCDEKSCLKMLDMQKNLDKCRECKRTGQCYNKNVITPTCDLCFGKQNKTKCLSTMSGGFGCTNPDNIADFKGVDPYYILVDSNDVNYAYTKKCKFCWNI